MNTLIGLITEALVAGDEQRPTALIQAVERLKAPHDALTSFEPPHEPFAALAADVPGYEKLRYAPDSLTDTERSGVVQLLRWVIRELSEWSAAADTRGIVLDAVFVALQMIGFHEDQWNLLPVDRTANAGVRDRLSELLRHTAMTMSAGSGRSHAYEQRIVDKVTHADAQENWAELAESWYSIAALLHGSLLFSQGVSYLACHYPDALRDVADHQSQMSVAWLVARQLPVPFRLRLARESTSQRFQFAALLSVGWSDLKNRQLPEGAPEELTQLLVQAAQDAAQWRSWMKVFNEHPLRFPWLQIPLGKALAQVPEEAMLDYVDTISLHPWSFSHSLRAGSSQADDRSCVGVCLQQFRTDASEARRKALWARAHERWSVWNFGGAEQTLIGICYSEIDYALVGHALENLTQEGRSAHIATNLSRIRALESEWQCSFTNLLNIRNRLFSQIQPSLTAELNPDDAWLNGEPLWPHDYTETGYSRRRYSA